MQAMRLPPNSGFSTRWPILNRGLNTRDWASSQSLMDDIALIITETLRTELDIRLKDLAVSSLVGRIAE
jgi:actin-related protein 8